MKTKSIILLIIMFIALGILGFSMRLFANLPGIEGKDEEKRIIKTVERAYAIDAEAMYTFELSEFPTVYINDPRYPVSAGMLKTIQELTNNPLLETAGYLDYKMAYYTWRRDATLHEEAVYAKAKAENRELTDEEKRSLVDSEGRRAPPRARDAERDVALLFISVEIQDDVALVVLDDGPATLELTLVLVDGDWYIAAIRGILTHY